jgi:hypothetical protein
MFDQNADIFNSHSSQSIFSLDFFCVIAIMKLEQLVVDWIEQLYENKNKIL